MKGSPCSTHRTAASKVTRGVLISSRSSQQDWEAVWRAGFIPQPNGSSFTGSRWLVSGREINPRVWNVHVGVFHAGALGTGWHLGEKPFQPRISCSSGRVSDGKSGSALSSSEFLPFLPSRAAALMKAEPGGMGR